MLVKYDTCNHQRIDAIGAYERAFDLGLDDPQCKDRLNMLQDRVWTMGYGADPPPVAIEMEDSDLRIATCDVYELDQHEPIEIAGLTLDNESDGADSETAGNDWHSITDDESDREG